MAMFRWLEYFKWDLVNACARRETNLFQDIDLQLDLLFLILNRSVTRNCRLGNTAPVYGAAAIS